MRDIRFRAWDKAKGEMQSWDYLVVGCNASRVLSWMQQEDKDKILMQYTGLKDKNGKEIYEGDIIKIVVSKFFPDEDGLEHEQINAEIYFDSGCFWFKGANRVDCNWHHYNGSEREVIGNLYENPELLKI